MSTNSKPLPLTIEWFKEKFSGLHNKPANEQAEVIKEVNEHMDKAGVQPKTLFSIDEIRNYITSQDSMGDVAHNLSCENIIKANQHEAVDA